MARDLVDKSITAVVLAAGHGTRMAGGGLPKVLHMLAGRTMLDRVCDALRQSMVTNICLILSKRYAMFTDFLARHDDIAVCLQHKQNGTAGAVAASAPLFKSIATVSYSDASLYKGYALDPNGYMLICPGDTPNIQASLLSEFIEYTLSRAYEFCVLGMHVPNPFGYGRLLLDDAKKHLKGIVEERDASFAEKKIRFCNSGLMLVKTRLLFELLQQVGNQNVQKEYYVTDCIKLAQGLVPVGVYHTKRWDLLLGVNDKKQLEILEQKLIGFDH